MSVDTATTTVDWAAVRSDFPVLRRQIDGAPIVYLDSGNTSQKPVQVIEAMDEFVRTSYAPINRSAYRLAGEATDRFESARAAVARLINAPQADEIVFTKNATEALNLVASSWGGQELREGDAVVLTHLEHHANIVPVADAGGPTAASRSAGSRSPPTAGSISPTSIGCSTAPRRSRSRR